MRRIILGGWAMLSVAACATSPNGAGIPQITSVGALANGVGQITADISASCGAGAQLLALPTSKAALAAGGGKVFGAVSGLAAQVDKYCTLGVLGGTLLTEALGAVNTAGARALGAGIAIK